MRHLLLLSNSRDTLGRYLHHAQAAVDAHLGPVRDVVFVPYAGVTVDPADYTARVAAALAPLGVRVRSVHEVDDPVALIADAGAIAVGGGNTFHLLATMQRTGVLDAVRARALAGVPYIGWSAGSVIACPTLQTTNDMPIVEPASFRALGLVAFQINAHFTDAHPPGFQGETRRERLHEFVTANPRVPVIGLPEGDWLEVHGTSITLRGEHSAPVFRGGMPETTLEAGHDAAALLEP